MPTDRREGERGVEALALTIGLYALGEISLGTAAERTGVSRWEMQEILDDHGVEVRLGPADMDDASDEVDTVRDFE